MNEVGRDHIVMMPTILQTALLQLVIGPTRALLLGYSGRENKVALGYDFASKDLIGACERAHDNRWEIGDS